MFLGSGGKLSFAGWRTCLQSLNCGLATKISGTVLPSMASLQKHELAELSRISFRFDYCFWLMYEMPSHLDYAQNRLPDMLIK